MPTSKIREPVEGAPNPLADLVTAALRAQQIQLEALAAWQNSLAALQRELWDEWICRWGGGVPIDG